MALRKILKWDNRVILGMVFLGNFVYDKGFMESLIGILLLSASGMLKSSIPKEGKYKIQELVWTIAFTVIMTVFAILYCK